MTESNSKAPTHFAYAVTRKGEDSFHTRVGAAWAYSDGTRMTVKLDALPVSGELSIRVPKPKAEEGEAEQETPAEQ